MTLIEKKRCIERRLNAAKDAAERGNVKSVLVNCGYVLGMVDTHDGCGVETRKYIHTTIEEVKSLIEGVTL